MSEEKKLNAATQAVSTAVESAIVEANGAFSVPKKLWEDVVSSSELVTVDEVKRVMAFRDNFISGVTNAGGIKGHDFFKANSDAESVELVVPFHKDSVKVAVYKERTERNVQSGEPIHVKGATRISYKVAGTNNSGELKAVRQSITALFS